MATKGAEVKDDPWQKTRQWRERNAEPAGPSVDPRLGPDFRRS
jgi:hypothetical protein